MEMDVMEDRGAKIFRIINKLELNKGKKKRHWNYRKCEGTKELKAENIEITVNEGRKRIVKDRVAQMFKWIPALYI